MPLLLTLTLPFPSAPSKLLWTHTTSACVSVVVLLAGVTGPATHARAGYQTWQVHSMPNMEGVHAGTCAVGRWRPNDIPAPHAGHAVANASRHAGICERTSALGVASCQLASVSSGPRVASQEIAFGSSLETFQSLRTKKDRKEGRHAGV